MIKQENSKEENDKNYTISFEFGNTITPASFSVSGQDKKWVEEQGLWNESKSLA